MNNLITCRLIGSNLYFLSSITVHTLSHFFTWCTYYNTLLHLLVHTYTYIKLLQFMKKIIHGHFPFLFILIIPLSSNLNIFEILFYRFNGYVFKIFPLNYSLLIIMPRIPSPFNYPLLLPSQSDFPAITYPINLKLRPGTYKANYLHGKIAKTWFMM